MALPSHLVGRSSHRPVRYQAFDSVEESSDLSGSSVEDDLTLSREALNSRRLAYRLLVSARRLFLQAKELMASGDEEGALELLAGVEELQGRALELVRRSDELGSRVSYRGGRGGRRYDISAVGDLADTLKTAAANAGDGIGNTLNKKGEILLNDLLKIKGELSDRFSALSHDPAVKHLKNNVVGKMLEIADGLRTGELSKEDATRLWFEHELPTSEADFKHEVDRAIRRAAMGGGYNLDDLSYDAKKKLEKYGGRLFFMGSDAANLAQKYPVAAGAAAVVPVGITGLFVADKIKRAHIDELERDRKRLAEEESRLRDLEKVAKSSQRGALKHSGGGGRRYDSSFFSDVAGFYEKYPIVSTGALAGSATLGTLGLMDLIRSHRRYNELKKLRDEKAEEVKELRRRLDSL